MASGPLLGKQGRGRQEGKRLAGRFQSQLPDWDTVLGGSFPLSGPRFLPQNGDDMPYLLANHRVIAQ